MDQSVSHVQTTRAARYMRQLCKHFGHKVPVECDDQQGSISLPFGTCNLLAQEEELTLTVSGDDTEKLKQVIGSHLERFAFRDALKVTWESTDKNQQVQQRP